MPIFSPVTLFAVKATQAINFTLNGSSNQSGYTHRVILKSAGFGGVNGGQVRVTMKARGDASCAWDNVFFGQVATAPSAVSLTRLTFGGANATPTVLAGASITSDWVNFVLTAANDYVVSSHVSLNGVAYNSSGSGVSNTDQWYKAAVDESGTSSVSGYTQDTAEGPFGVSKFEWR